MNGDIVDSKVDIRPTRAILVIPPVPLSKMIEEVKIAYKALPWREEYYEYQTSGWFTCTLQNPTGSCSDNVIIDGTAVMTNLMSWFPALGKFIRSIKLDIMWIRLAAMKRGAGLWEHTDYAELEDRPRLRLHIPLLTNPDAVIVFPGQMLHMPIGYMWILNPKEIRHAAVNRGFNTRVHVIIDCYITQTLSYLIDRSRSVPQSLITRLPLLTKSRRIRLLTQAAKLATLGFFQAAEHLLLESFYYFDLQDMYSYDLVIELYEKTLVFNAPERLVYWRERKKIHLAQERGV